MHHSHDEPLLDTSVPAAMRPAELLRYARAVFDQVPGLTWSGFYRLILHDDGAVRQLFPENDAYRRAKLTPEYRQVMQMFDALGEGNLATSSINRVITVRLPAELHESLKAAARRRRQSLNRFCCDALFEAAHAPSA